MSEPAEMVLDGDPEPVERRGATDLDPSVLAAFRGADESDEEFADSAKAIASEMGVELDTSEQAATADAPEETAVSDTPVAPEGAEKESMSALETALAALRRDGWRPDELDKLPRKTILAMGEKRAKVQADTDAMQADLLKLKEAKAPPVEKAEPSVDLSKAMASLRENFGEEAASALELVLKSQVEPMSKVNADLASALASVQLELARRDFVDRFPEAKAPDKWQSAFEKAKKLRPGCESDEEAFTLAAQMMSLKSASAVEDEARRNKARGDDRAKELSTPTANGRKSVPKEPDSNEREYQAWAAAQRGAPKAEVERILHGVR